MTYSERLKDPRWQKKRLEVLNRDNFTCVECGDSVSTLHVHHIKYSRRNPWEEDAINLITVCLHCHALATHYEEKDFKIIKREKSFRKNGDIIFFLLHTHKEEYFLYMVKMLSSGENIEMLAAFTKSDLDVLIKMFPSNG